MSFKIEGHLRLKGEKTQVTERFFKQNFVLETKSQFPNHIEFQLINDRITLLEQVLIDEELEVEFRLEGRRWTDSNGKTIYINTFSVFGIKKLERKKMSYKVEGTLHLKGDVQQITQRFSKREFVIELDKASRYPQFVSFQLTGHRMNLLDEFHVGEELEVEFRLNGRQWTSPKGEVRYFNSLPVFGLKRVGAEQPSPQPAYNPPVEKTGDDGFSDSSFSDDEIPF